MEKFVNIVYFYLVFILINLARVRDTKAQLHHPWSLPLMLFILLPCAWGGTQDPWKGVFYAC